MKQNLLFTNIYDFLNISLNLTIICLYVCLYVCISFANDHKNISIYLCKYIDIPIGVFLISQKDHVPIFVDALIARMLTRQWHWAKSKTAMTNVICNRSI